MAESTNRYEIVGALRSAVKELPFASIAYVERMRKLATANSMMNTGGLPRASLVLLVPSASICHCHDILPSSKKITLSLNSNSLLASSNLTISRLCFLYLHAKVVSYLEKLRDYNRVVKLVSCVF